MLHIIIDKCFESMTENENHDFYDYCWKVKSIAYYLAEGECVNESLICYLIAIILGIHKNINQEVLCKAAITDKPTNDIILEFHNALHSEISDREIDPVVNTYENITKFLQNSEYDSIESEFLWFLEQYQKQDIEFKRE